MTRLTILGSYFAFVTWGKPIGPEGHVTFTKLAYAYLKSRADGLYFGTGVSQSIRSYEA